ncbi:hypothetical protein L3X38_028244 [Prunus dulcis]|uniref:Uncharacterized protein n=1 Tax=Prunus dulcis TaxID=3755 RepID=A0AAD4VS35_PRUDU|nr:hypothetical protein L3X38_028244 [Prunus dulcis]
MRDSVVRSVSKVRHVSALRKNLISLGALDRERYSYKAKEEKFLVTQGGGENSTKEDYKMESGVVCTKEKRAKDLIINEPVQRNEVTSSLKTGDVSQG